MTDRPTSWSMEGAGDPPGGFGTPPGMPPPPSGFAPTPPPAGPQRDGPPWERRSGILDLGAMFATVRDVLFDAQRTFSRMVREGGLGGPLLYLLILATICGWIAQLWGVVIGEAMSGLLGGFGGSGMESSELSALGLDSRMQAFMQSPVFQVVQAFMLPAIVLVLFFIKTAIFHLFLLVVGGARRPFETTARTVAYVDGSVALFQLVPFCGWLITILYGVVVTIIGLARAHETSAGRAAAAVLLPLVLCCLCGLALVVAMAMMVAGSGL